MENQTPPTITEIAGESGTFPWRKKGGKRAAAVGKGK